MRLTRPLDSHTRQALRAFDGADRFTRAHVAIRAATCPISEIHRLLGDGDHVLDYGCGHGLGAIRLALAEPDRTVLGVDVDEGKLTEARRAAAAAGVAGRVRFELVAPTWRPAVGSASAVLFVDVLYLLPPESQFEVVTTCVRAVGSGGSVVVKEMGTRPRWKRHLVATQEHLSVKLLRITDGAGVLMPDPDDLDRWLSAAGGSVRRVDLSRRRLHPHMALIART